MLKNLMVFFSFALTLPAFGVNQRKTEMNAQEGVKSVSAAFMNQSVYEGISFGRKPCKIEAVRLEGPFGGIQITITDHLGNSTSFSINSPNERMYETEERYLDYSTHKWEVVGNGYGYILAFKTYEDVQDFDLTIVDVFPKRVAYCSVIE